MPAITTHVLDTAQGLPATGIPVLLEVLREGAWAVLAQGITNQDGRVRLLEDAAAGSYRLTFETSVYLGPEAFYPRVAIHFNVSGQRHHHIPLLLSPFGYSTYRGS